MDLTNVNTDDVTIDDKFEVLPAGKYRMIITESKKKLSKTPGCEMLNAKLQVVEPGKFINRTLFDNMITQHPSSPQAVNIGLGRIKQLKAATGVQAPKDSAEFHNKPILVAVTVKPDQNGNPGNNINWYYPVKAGPQTPPPVANPPQQSEQTQAAASVPSSVPANPFK